MWARGEEDVGQTESKMTICFSIVLQQATGPIRYMFEFSLILDSNLCWKECLTLTLKIYKSIISGNWASVYLKILYPAGKKKTFKNKVDREYTMKKG